MRNVNGVDSEKCASHRYACHTLYVYIALLSRLSLVQAIVLDSIRYFFCVQTLFKPFISRSLSSILAAYDVVAFRLFFVYYLFLDVKGTLPYTSICKLHFLFR